MKIIKRLLIVTSLATLAIGITACGSKKSKRTVPTHAVRITPEVRNSETVTEVTEFSGTGRIFGLKGQSQSNFDHSVKSLAATFINFDDRDNEVPFGSVSKDPDNENTGMRFSGSNNQAILELSTGGHFTPHVDRGGPYYLRMINSQKLMVQIRDEVAAASDDYAGFDINFAQLDPNVRAEINNDVLSVVFQNDILEFSFVGGYKQYEVSNGKMVSYIDGVARFKDRKTGKEYVLGEFYIETCKMIRCK